MLCASSQAHPCTDPRSQMPEQVLLLLSIVLEVIGQGQGAGACTAPLEKRGSSRFFHLASWGMNERRQEKGVHVQRRTVLS